MRASTRRTLALCSALALGLAACGNDDTDPTAADQSEEGDDEVSPDDLDPNELPDESEQPDAAEPPTFEEGDLEDGEVVPGVRVQVPEGGDIQAGPGPAGSIYANNFEEESAVVFVEAAAAGLSIDQLLEGLEGIEESGEAEVTRGPEDYDVEGADEARIVELLDANEREATLIVAVAGEGAVSLAVERPQDAEFDADSIVESLELDGERIAELPQQPQQPQQPAPQPEGEGEAPVEPQPEDGEAQPDDE